MTALTRHQRMAAQVDAAQEHRLGIASLWATKTYGSSWLLAHRIMQRALAQRRHRQRMLFEEVSDA